MRILTWNIMHGGGADRIPALALAMLESEPDLVVVTEARRRFAGQLAAALADAGLAHGRLPRAPDGVNAVLLASRTPLEPAERADLPAALRPRWSEACLPDSGLRVLGVHLPEAGRRAEHLAGWRALRRFAAAHRDAPTVIAGDLNAWRSGAKAASGPGATNLGRLAAMGYADAWCRANPADQAGGGTWRSPSGRPFRLDYVLVSAPLASSIRAARVAVEPRAGGLSDHGALCVELAFEPGLGAESAAGTGKNDPPGGKSPKKTA